MQFNLTVSDGFILFISGASTGLFYVFWNKGSEQVPISNAAILENKINKREPIPKRIDKNV